MNGSGKYPVTGRAMLLMALIAALATAATPATVAWGNPASPSAALTVAKAGTYHYRQTSPATSPSPEGTLIVGSPAQGTQTWTANFGPKIPVSTSVMSYRGAGIYVVAQSEHMSGTTVSCTFAAPMPWPPSPPTVGVTFSGHATCTRGAILKVTGKISGTAMMRLDGKAVSTAVVDSTAVMSVVYLGTRYEADVTRVDWYAPSLRMPVQTATHVVIPAQGTTSDSTFVLESSKPS